MTLQEQIDELSKGFREQMPPEILSQIMEENAKVVDSGIDAESLNVGDTAPAFILPNQAGEDVSSSGLLKNGALVISFYRGSWCPYCNLEIRALQGILPEIKKLGADLIAISPQTPDYSLSFQEKHALGFHVLSDVGNRVAKQFKLVFTLPEKLQGIYQQLQLDVPAHNGDGSYELPMPATYVIDRDGTIVEAFVNPDYTRRMEPKAILHSLRNLIVR